MCIRVFVRRNLSGGEKSCATLALLLAMQVSNESPSLVMDEFDVRTCTVVILYYTLHCIALCAYMHTSPRNVYYQCNSTIHCIVLHAYAHTSLRNVYQQHTTVEGRL
jgi:hypothetical protein